MEAMKKKTHKYAAWKITALWLTVVVAGILGFGIYQYKTTGWDFSALSASLTRVKTWINDHKNKPRMEARAKSESKMSATEPPLHFEFYTTLPNMRLAESEVTQNEKKEAAAVVGETKPLSIKKNAAIVTPDELERELGGDLKSATSTTEQFAVQVGVFRSIAAAEQYQGKLREAGFHATVAAFGADKKNLYRVQLGPYANKNKASLLKHELGTHGINGVIYKLNK